MKTVKALIDEQLILIDEKIYEKYKAKEVTYLKIDENILNNLSEILQSLTKAKNKRFVFNNFGGSTNTKSTAAKVSIFENGVFNASHLRGLVEKTLVQEYYLQKDRIKTYEGEIENLEKLSEVQEKALLEINEGFRDGKMSCFMVLPVQEKRICIWKKNRRNHC